jgi:hypothetical protein
MTPPLFPFATYQIAVQSAQSTCGYIILTPEIIIINFSPKYNTVIGELTRQDPVLTPHFLTSPPYLTPTDEG